MMNVKNSAFYNVKNTTWGIPKSYEWIISQKWNLGRMSLVRD